MGILSYLDEIQSAKLDDVLNLQANLMFPGELTYYKHLLEKSTSIKFLDLGCGNGSYLKQISEKYPQHQYTGLDENSSMVLMAKEKFRNSKNVKILEGSLFNVESILQSGIWDVVFHRATIIYCANRLQEYAKIIHNLLTPGGALIGIEADDQFSIVMDNIPSLQKLMLGLSQTMGNGRIIARLIPKALEENNLFVKSFNPVLINKYNSQNTHEFHSLVFAWCNLVHNLNPDSLSVKDLQKIKEELIKSDKEKGLDFTLGLTCITAVRSN